VVRWLELVTALAWAATAVWLLVFGSLSSAHEHDPEWDWVHPMQYGTAYLMLTAALLSIGLVLNRMVHGFEQ
jgi:hypothetical protein